jgi:hypothetical protein
LKVLRIACSSICLYSVRWLQSRQGERAIHPPAEAQGLSGPLFW